MTRSVATVGLAHMLRQPAAKMAIHSAGDAVVLDPDAALREIVAERDILVSLARGQGPDQERDCRPPQFRHVYASPSWPRELAAVVMVDRGRRHLVVCEGGDLVGVLSMRDVVRCWTQEGANCALPRLPAEVASTGPFATSSPSSAEIDAAKVDEGHAVLNSVLGF